MTLNTLLKDLTIDDFQELIKSTVISTLDEYFNDLEEEKNLKPDVIQRLNKFKKKINENNNIGIPAEEVYQKLNL